MARSSRPARALLFFAALGLAAGGAVAEEARTGFIQVICERGAEVFLDGKRVGETRAEVGGIVIPDVPAGEHRVRIEDEGCDPFEAAVAVVEGGVAVVRVARVTPKPQVEPAGKETVGELRARTGRVAIASVPIECVITSSQLGLSKAEKKALRWTIRDAPEGRCVIELAALGKKLVAAGDVAPGTTLEVFANFLAGTVSVTSVPVAKEALGAPDAPRAAGWGAGEDAELDALARALGLTPEQRAAAKTAIGEGRREFERRLAELQGAEHDISALERVGDEIAERTRARIEEVLSPDQKVRFREYLEAQEGR